MDQTLGLVKFDFPSVQWHKLKRLCFYLLIIIAAIAYGLNVHAQENHPQIDLKKDQETHVEKKQPQKKNSNDEIEPVRPFSNRAIAYGAMIATVEVDGLVEVRPLALRFSGIRSLPKNFAVDFQLLIGPNAVKKNHDFYSVDITVKTQIVGAGVFRLQKYFDLTPRLTAFGSLGYCYCVIKSTRPEPVEGSTTQVKLSQKAVDRGSITYGVGVKYQVNEKSALALETDRLVDDRRLFFSGITASFIRTF